MNPNEKLTPVSPTSGYSDLESGSLLCGPPASCDSDQGLQGVLLRVRLEVWVYQGTFETRKNSMSAYDDTLFSLLVPR